MAKKWGRCDFSQLEAFAARVETLAANRAALEAFFALCAKALAARLLALVVKRTPVGQYPKSSGKKGGTLRRGWTGGTRQDALQYAQSLAIARRGRVYEIEILNPVEYAVYVEYGHRTPDHKGWVRGAFMMTISADELERAAPAILEALLVKFLKEHFT